jgi:hypothetical protein
MGRNEHFLGEVPPQQYPEPQKFAPDRAAALPFRSTTRNVAQRGNFSIYPQVATTASQQVLPANPKRVYLLIQNNGTDYIRVNYGNNASALTTRIPPNGGSYDYPVVPINAIYILAESGSQNVVVEEAVDVPENPA